MDFSIVQKAMRDALPEPMAGAGPYKLSGPGKLEGMFEDAGLSVLESGEVNCPFNYPDLETFLRANSSTGSFQGMLQVFSEERLKSALSNAVEQFRLDSREYLIQPNFFKVIAAAR